MREKLKKPVYILLFGSAIALAAVFCVAQKICVYDRYIIEAGTAAPAERFVRIDFGNAAYTEDSDFFDVSVPGHYDLRIKNGLFTHSCELSIIDTVAPAVYTTDAVTAIGKECPADTFIERISDVTECTTEYAGSAPDYSLTDVSQTVTLRVTDAGDNSTEATAQLTVLPFVDRLTLPLGSGLPQAEDFVTNGESAYYADGQPAADMGTAGTYPVDIVFRDVVYTVSIDVEDTQPPAFVDTSDIYVSIGEPIAYKSLVAAEDDSGSVTISADASGVDPTRLGSYVVYYTATDPSGNSSEAAVTLHIIDGTADEWELYNRVDDILAGIIDDGMDARERAWAIYGYVTSHISYIGDSERGDIIRAATQALDLRQGDCYVYASLSEELLRRAGFEVMMISRVSDSSTHDWNLVDIGDGHGWYHFDATPRVDHPVIFLWDDATLAAYSAAHSGSHDYDRTQYPYVP